MSIPLIICCGTYPSCEVLAEGAQCPVCAAPTLQLIKETFTPCLCFIPLCFGGDSRTYASCARCQATMSRAFYPSSGGAAQPPHQATRALFHPAGAGVKGGGDKHAPLLPQGGE